MILYDKFSGDMTGSARRRKTIPVTRSVSGKVCASLIPPFARTRLRLRQRARWRDWLSFPSKTSLSSQRICFYSLALYCQNTWKFIKTLIYSRMKNVRYKKKKQFLWHAVLSEKTVRAYYSPPTQTRLWLGQCAGGEATHKLFDESSAWSQRICFFFYSCKV